MSLCCPLPTKSNKFQYKVWTLLVSNKIQMIISVDTFMCNCVPYNFLNWISFRRQSCLQRHIWESCNCMDPEVHLPFWKQSLICGMSPGNNYTYVPNTICIEEENMVHHPLCKEKLEKFFKDIHCVREVKKEHMMAVNETFECQCEEPCESFAFDESYRCVHKDLIKR